ncbi:alanyl-tRNA editing protein [Paenibacillus graminis]|uniref:alanyl-tRNA editing protein n=1 Tax=Paenibacillus graminis TaxID=189425 RepID=UPI002DBB07AF|nr:DHHA1 domain-containing protein [Paenibacillus graminis]MEC0166999.1 DHHA1 domain-containing protein [Paenibacillus graminis]
MTKKLYYESAYLKDWHTSISQVVEREDGLYLILEETAFYPHGGGQPCDAGTIAGIPVLDVILEEDEVLHKVERLPDGGQVSCQLDWNRRFDHMQQHSGQHLLSAVFRELFQAMTLSFHLGNDYATIDIELQELTLDQLAAAEREVNRQVVLDRNIVSYLVTPEEMAGLPLVKLPKVTENIRIVEIAGVEHNACGGTHVASTGAIGMVKLLRAEKQKGNIRITFKCGGRALDEANDNQRILGALSAKFNTGKDEIIDRIEKWEAEQKQLLAELAVLREQNDMHLAKEMLSVLGPEARVVAHIFEDKSLKDLQSLAAKLTANTELPVLLLTAMENKVVLACSSSAGLSCGAFFKAYLSGFQGKGGGSDKMAQAGFPAWDEVMKFYEFAKVHL